MLQLIASDIKTRISRYDVCIFSGIIIYILFISTVSLYRYETFFADIDLAIFDQSFWTTINYGGILENSLEPKGMSHLGIHFSPILLTLIPIYFLFPGPETLILSQTFLLSMGVIPIYLLGKEILGEREGCCVGILYLLYPPLHGVNLYDFHEVAFLPFLLGMAIWGLITGRNNLSLIFCLSCLLVKEDVFPIICMIGLLGLIWTKSRPLREKWHYVLLCILPILMLFFYMFVMRPIIYNGDIYEGTLALSQYANLSDNLSINNDSRIFYLIMLLLPLIFLPLLSPEILFISIPAILENLLSPDSFYFSISSHHSAPLIPILFSALIVSLYKISKFEIIKNKLKISYILVLILIVSVTSSALFSPAIQELKFMTSEQSDLEKHVESLTSVIQKIPPNASISTQENIAPHLSGRLKIWHWYNNEADLIIYDTAYPQGVVFSEKRAKIEKEYELVAEGKGIYVFFRKS